MQRRSLERNPPVGLTEPSLDFPIPRHGGVAIKESLSLQPLLIRLLVSVLALCELLGVGLMPQAGQFLALLTVGFMPTDACLAWLGNFRLGFHRWLNWERGALPGPQGVIIVSNV